LSRFTDYIPPCLVVTAPKGQFPAQPVASMAMRLQSMGFPAPGEGERVISYWTIDIAKMVATVDPDNRGVLDPAADGLRAQVLAEGSWVCLVTDRALRIACIDGSSRFGRMIGGWSVQTNTGEHRMFHVVWPLNTIDSVEIDPAEGRQQVLRIDRRAPVASFFLAKARPANSSYIPRGFGLVTRTGTLAAHVIEAAAEMQTRSADPDRAAAARRVQQGHRDRNADAAIATFATRSGSGSRH
jgi:hypothetical protein